LAGIDIILVLKVIVEPRFNHTHQQLSVRLHVFCWKGIFPLVKQRRPAAGSITEKFATDNFDC
jgi:hypothetical protein